MIVRIGNSEGCVWFIGCLKFLRGGFEVGSLGDGDVGV